jgi:serine/threonine protein kinase
MISNKYKILNKISEGSFGLVYKGQNIRTKEYVAIKIESIKNMYIYYKWQHINLLKETLEQYIRI